jgi:hypothetical protein
MSGKIVPSAKPKPAGAGGQEFQEHAFICILPALLTQTLPASKALQLPNPS